MNVKGKVVFVGPIQGGTSKTTGNAWKKQDFEVRYEEGQYPKSVLFSTLDPNVVGRLAVGQQVSVDFDISVREWTSQSGEVRRFNDIRVWRDGIKSAAANTAQQGYQGPRPPYVPPVGSVQAQGPVPQTSSELPF